MAERPTFSPLWHRVRAMAPRLRPHVQINRQLYRGRRWYVVQDPTSNQFYRLNPIGHEFVAMLDGVRTVESIWHEVLERHGDEAPTQQEVVELLGQLYNSNLLSADTAPETEQLLRRGRDRLKKKVASQAIGIMYFRMRVFNPDGLLTALEPIFRPMLGRVGFGLWLVLIVSALVALAGHVDELFNDERIQATLHYSNWLALGAVFIVAKAWHELGHGLILKRMGGQVPEFGLMLLVLFPAPYVDASAAWALPSKWQRIAVGAGGMIFELGLASLAAFVWISTLSAPESLTHQIAYNAMVTASISTILFNANPLMRFDGYYMLSDLIEMPNLMGRSMNMLKYLMQKHVYRLDTARTPGGSRAEHTILIVYGIAALAYRIFLFFSITLFVMGRLFAIGLVLAIWTAAAWFLIPVGKFIHWLASSPQLSDHRSRTITLSVVLIAGGVVLLGMVPFPDHRMAWGVIESEQRSGVYFGVAGFVVEVKARTGDFVEEGDAILVCENPDLVSRIRQIRARIEELRATERSAMGQSDIAADVTRTHIAKTAEELVFLEDLAGKLTVRAPHDGVLVGKDPGNLIGSFVRMGDPVCAIVNMEDVRIVAALSTAQAAPLKELETDDQSRLKAEIRSVARVSEVVGIDGFQLLEAGMRELPHQGLAQGAGGDIALDPTDQQGRFARAPQFYAYLTADEVIGMPGERVRVRFTLPDKPLLSQWADRLRRLVQGRIDI